MKKNKEFWITNISNKNVSLADLNITIPARSSINLLSRRSYLTEEQLNKSYESGSLFAKRDKLVKRIYPPKHIQKNILTVSEYPIEGIKKKSILESKTEQIEDFNFLSGNNESNEKEFQEIADIVKEISDE